MSGGSRAVERLVTAPATPAEGPLWDADRGVLWWVDIMAPALHAHDPATGADRVFDLRGPVGTVVLVEDGDLVVALADRVSRLRLPPGVAVADLPASLAETALAPLEADRSDTRANDGKAGPDGALWVGTMALDAQPGSGSLYRVETGTPPHRILDGAGIPNGLDWPDPLDPTRLLWIDSLAGGIDLLVVEDGRLVSRERTVTIVGGLPDGMTLDADGRCWVAVHGAGEVRCIAEGRVVEVIEVGLSKVTSCAFGGPGLTDLYITAATGPEGPGGLFRCRDVGRGRLPFRMIDPPRGIVAPRTDAP